MLRWSKIPKPVLYVAALVFSAATISYTFTWMWYARWEPRAGSLGIVFSESATGDSVSITRITEGSPASDAGMHAGDQMTAINGRPLVNMDPWYDEVVRGSAGDSIQISYTPADTNEARQITLTLPPPATREMQARLSVAIGRELANSYPLLFLIVGLYVLFARITDGHAWMLALLFAAFIAGPAYEKIRPVLDPGLRPWAMGYAMIFAFLGPAFFYAFFTTFPDPSPIERRAPWLKWVVTALCAVIALPSAASLFFQGRFFPFYVQAGWMTRGQYGNLARFVLIGFIFLGFMALISNSFEEKDPYARKRFRVVLWGTIAGFGPEVARLTANALGVEAANTPWLKAACLAALTLVPASMAYSVVKHRVMEIPLLLRRSARYLIVRRGLDLLSLGLMAWLVIYFAELGRFAVGGWLRSMSVLGSAEPLANVGPIVFATGAFIGAVFYHAHQRMRSKYMERVDRAFFRSTYDTRQILQDLADKLRTAENSSQLAGMLETQITQALHPQSLATYFRAENQLKLERFAPGPIPESLVFLDTKAPLLQELAQRGQPWEMAPPDASAPPDLPELARLREHLEGSAPVVDRTDVLSQLVPLRPECLVPVMDREKNLTGLLVLGERLSEEPYSDEDERLLALVAGQSGVALENIRLAEEMAAKQTAEAKRANEMSIAREVQVKLFPQRMPALETLDYAGSCDQARTIGGDYYDYLDMGKGRVGLALADISGKGIFAALLMANLQANLRSQYALALSDKDGLAVLMRSVNRLFFESVTPGLYATMFIADYSDERRSLRYINCGHNPPLLIRASGPCEKLEATATVVGLVEEWDCTVGEVDLGAGDVLVVYSDGVTEAASDDGEFFGDARLEATIRANIHLPAAELTRRIATTVHTFSGKEQEDDLTLLVAKAR